MLNFFSNLLESMIQKIKSDSRYFYWLLIIVLIIALIFTSRSCKSAQLEVEYSKNNIMAIKDELRTEKNKNGELQYLKLSFVSDVDKLKTLNKELYDEVQKMNGRIVSMSKTIVSIEGTLVDMEQDRRNTPPIFLKNDTLEANFSFSDSGKTWNRSIKGKSVLFIKNATDSTFAQPLYDKLTEDKMNLTIFASLRKRDSDDMYEYVLRTDYPNAILNVEGFVNPIELNKNPLINEDKWIIGPFIGAGFGTNFTIMPQIGIGLTYKIIGF
jgi:hypothetical protein